jgi:hypothetical protein
MRRPRSPKGVDPNTPLDLAHYRAQGIDRLISFDELARYGKLDFGRQRRRAPICFRTVFVSHRDPERAITPAQTAENRECSAETGNSGLAQDCVVGLGDGVSGLVAAVSGPLGDCASD